MIILGITGAIGHGKSTIAEILTKLEPNSKIFETSKVISEVATQLCKQYNHKSIHLEDIESINSWLSHLPGILSTILNRPIDPKLFKLESSMLSPTKAEYVKLWEFINWANYNPKQAHTLITQANKASFRPLLQWIGGYCVENISPTIWNTELIVRARKAEDAGCALAILGGIRFKEEALQVQTNGGIIIKVVRPKMHVQDSNDPTERQRSGIRPDKIIINDGLMEDLITKVHKLYSEIMSSKSKA